MTDQLTENLMGNLALFGYEVNGSTSALRAHEHVPAWRGGFLGSSVVRNFRTNQAGKVNERNSSWWTNRELERLGRQAAALRTQKRGLMQKLLTGQWRLRPHIVKEIPA